VATEIRWCKIIASGVLRFDGPDAQSFLQSQLTNNVLAIDDQHSQYTGYCTAKGRLLASMLLWRREGAYYMMLPRELCEPLRKRLSMYILRAKVKAADVSDEYALFGVDGADAAAMVTTLAGAAPHAVHEAAYGNYITALKLPVNRYLIAASALQAGKIEAVLTAAASGAAETLWSTLDIEAGIPTVVAATQEQFVPQTVNFDLIRAVSFDKGCYPGQEIVARTHYLGKVKQRMVRARVAANAALGVPQAGDKLYAEPFGDQACGMIVSAVSTVSADAAHHEVLAVIQTSTLETAGVHWKTVDGPVLMVQPLPYAVA
jgi:folate-binding protein YgfZ